MKPLNVPRYYDEPAKEFATKISIVLSKSPVCRNTVYACVNEFIQKIRECEADGYPLAALGFDCNLAATLEINGCLTDRQLARLTMDQLINMRGSTPAKARLITAEMRRLNIASHGIELHKCEDKRRKES